ncbi:MAG: hypothetical protein ABI416_16495 [Ginsengibacter sp.]
MNIDRNNYEEYFLLYADNELTDSEKAEVLMFVKDNKDLEEEFRTIHHTICKPDAHVGLTDKSFLLRGDEKAFINEKNYEEVFVLYHDNELTVKQKKATEDFLAQHLSLKNEFELIGMARLAPGDALVFPNKKSLYRKEKEGKVVPIIFWRALVAAVFIGCGIWITELYVHKGVKMTGVTVQLKPVKQPATINQKEVSPGKKPLNDVVHSASNQSPSKSKAVSRAIEKLEKSSSKQETYHSTLAKTTVQKQHLPGENSISPPEDKMNHATDSLNDEVVTANKGIKNIPNEQISENIPIEPSKELAQNAVQANEKVIPVASARHASYVFDANENSQNYVFYDITTEEFKKTKFGSFIKKVKRVIARNNPISRLLPGDDKQVVSN